MKLHYVMVLLDEDSGLTFPTLHVAPSPEEVREEAGAAILEQWDIFGPCVDNSRSTEYGAKPNREGAATTALEYIRDHADESRVAVKEGTFRI